MKNPIVITNPEFSIELTKEQAEQIGIDASLDEQRGELKTVGAWDVPKSFKAVCVSGKFTTDFYTKCTEKTFYGIRTMTNVRSSGYCLEGQVSIKGKKYSAFTSSEFVRIEGKLMSVSVIHARVR